MLSNGIRIKETEVEVNLEDLLHHTTNRILEIEVVDKEIISILSECNKK